MISIQNLTFGYRGSKKKVFQDFNLSIESSGIYGLLGRNATGKSTLLYLLSGMLRPKEGEVRIGGYSTKEMSKQLLEKLYLVTEEFELPLITLRKYVALYSPYYKNFSQEIMDACVKEFELDYDQKLCSLSMGTKKKAMMSFALATNTELLLMDEPTNGLDIPSKRQFRKVIANCMNEQRTIVISTHQVHDVENLLDHIVMIGENGLLLNASNEEIAAQYTFGTHPQGEVLYSERSVDGPLCVARREEGEDETPVNIELLFEYLTSKK